MGIHFMSWFLNFQLYIIQSNLELDFLCVAVFVKILFQHINYPYMLRICRPNFMKFKDGNIFFQLDITNGLNSSKCKKCNYYGSV